MESVAQFTDTTIVMFAKLVLAVVLGGIIGTERAVMARQAAGTRTFGLVALGACLFVLTANYVDLAHLGIVNFDPMRVAAAIITGVGFLGGGLIIFRGETQHGITTAAGLWISSAVGIAVAFGLYAIAIFSTVLVLLIFTGMWYMENRFKHWFEDHKPEIERKADNGL
ncbi:MAG: MgtC/SapB family protein [bacterium]|nr:MgtC/SapB family protein [bacterium]